MHMPALNLPHFAARLQERDGQTEIFDEFRKKQLRLTPEEWVRQHLLHYLTRQLAYPKTRLAVEKSITLNGMTRRYDAVIFDSSGQKPILLIECKAPEIAINQAVFDQVARYNQVLEVDYFLLSNGLNHHFAYVDKNAARYRHYEEIPNWSTFTALLTAV